MEMANCHANWTLDWTITGIAIGWLIMAMSIGQIAFFVCLVSFSGSEIFYIVTLWIFIFNSLATILWLSGIAKNLLRLMLASLMWWFISLCLWIRFIYIVTNGKHSTSEYVYHRIFLYTLTAFSVSLYVLAVMCYRSLKGVIEKNRLDVLRMTI